MGCFNVLTQIKQKYEKSKTKNGSKQENLPTRVQTLPSRTREFSSPLALDATPMKEDHSRTPQPLPLPPSPRSRLMKERRHAQPLPLAYPPLKTSGSNKAGTLIGSIRYFSYDEIVAARYTDQCVSECLSSTIYMASFFIGDGASSSSKMLEATLNWLRPSTQDVREFLNEVNILGNLQHPNLCKFLGFHATESSNSSSESKRMLVYERLRLGSLDHLLFVKSDSLPSLNWNKRLKIAICAARGLTFLHEEGPLKAMYCDFSAANIQVDKEFNAKLSGYGCVGPIPEEEFLNNSMAAGNLSKETFKKGMLTPKSNVWSFGIVLLELLTGRKNFDGNLPKEERNLIKWCRPFLATNTGLSEIMDPQLRGQFPPKATRPLAEIAQRCLQKEPSERPTMRTIVEHLEKIQDMYSFLFPNQRELARSKSWNNISRSTNFEGIISRGVYESGSTH